MINEISKELFEDYVEIQRSGMYNMITDAAFVIAELGCSKSEYITIIRHYSELSEKFGII